MTSGSFSNYYDKESITASVGRGDHRTVIGGMWDAIGDLQMNFLRARGLVEESRLLDIGCGSLRLGIRAVEFLSAGNYWGTDLNPALLDAGYDREIVPAELRDKLPRSHLVTDGNFSFPGIPSNIDFAIATSVFTHLPLNHMRLCLTNLARHVKSPCRFYFTIFTPPNGRSVTQSHVQPKGGVTTHTDRDPYHYTFADVEHAAKGTDWALRFIGEWQHPRNQMIVEAVKAL